MMRNLRRQKNDFKTADKHKTSEYYYDIAEDWALIESSFFMQYGIRLRLVNDMPWDEFCSYLQGIMPNTPLGNMVQIRSETDRDIIKGFTAEQKRIHSEWQKRLAYEKPENEVNNAIEMFKNVFKNLAEGGA